MKLFLLSLLLVLVPSVAQAGRLVIPPGLKYDGVVLIKSQTAKRSSWGIVTNHHGCRTLVIIQRQPKREVRPHVRIPKIENAKPFRPGYVAPTPQPVIILNPFVKEQ